MVVYFIITPLVSQVIVTSRLAASIDPAAGEIYKAPIFGVGVADGVAVGVDVLVTVEVGTGLGAIFCPQPANTMTNDKIPMTNKKIICFFIRIL